MVRGDPKASLIGLIDRASRLPSVLSAQALAVAVQRRAADEWWAAPPYRLMLERPAPQGLAATPKDLRPVSADAGRHLLSGRFELAGAELMVEPGGDPWDRPSPTRLFAVALHRFDWARELIATGDAGAREFLRLFLGWRDVFGRITPFAWGPDTLPRRVFNLACAAPHVTAIASDAEKAILAGSLAAQARHLIALSRSPASAAERLTAAAVAGASLSGPAGEKLLARVLPRLSAAVAETVLADGGVKSRSPQAGLELLFDLLCLDDVLLQRGREAPPEVARAIDRLSSGLRFFTLGDGALAAFQGGEAVAPARVEAACQHDKAETRSFGFAPHAGYHRLAGRSLLALIDAAPPAEGPWSLTACAQPLAMEVSAGRDRLIVNTGWSADAAAPQAMRLTAAGSTASLGDGSAGAPLQGFLARMLGPRLIGGARRVEARRNENEAGIWLELAHDGWTERHGLIHERRLFMDANGDELRGEDRFAPSADTLKERPHLTPFTIRFHFDPEAKASLARDKRSVLLRGPSDRGWWLRTDAKDVTLEPSVVFENGQPRRTQQLVLRGNIPADGAKVRWKLTPVEPE